jgi:hypothetical protein
MKSTLVVAAVAAILAASSAHGAIEFDQNVTNNVIYGSGNANGGWTTDRNNGIELGLRAHVRFPLPLNVFNSNGDGTYNHAAGNDAGRPLWSFDWSVNTNTTGTTGLEVGELTYVLRMDYDPGPGTLFQTFDPINVPFADHSFGDNTTAEGAGVEAADAAGYATLLATSNLVQQSWRLDFFDSVAFPFDPNLDGVYDFQLEALRGGNTAGVTSIQVIVGAGAAVPEATTLVMWVGLASCGGVVAWRTKGAAP